MLTYNLAAIARLFLATLLFNSTNVYINTISYRKLNWCHSTRMASKQDTFGIPSPTFTLLSHQRNRCLANIKMFSFPVNYFSLILLLATLCREKKFKNAEVLASVLCPHNKQTKAILGTAPFPHKYYISGMSAEHFHNRVFGEL